jgi:peptidyl-tRNA hydrolase, PTH1 family
VSDAQPWLVVGLGNPGPQYAGHRHNVGFQVVEQVGREVGAGGLRKHKRARAVVSETRAGDVRMVLAEPTTFMNDSGGAVTALRDFYKVSDLSRIVVVHDELDLPYGALRLKLGGGDNGHNGLRSIRRSVGSGDFHRLRFGIGRPPGRLDPAVFVLRDFSPAERADLGVHVARAAEAVQALVTQGLTAAQNTYND